MSQANRILWKIYFGEDSLDEDDGIGIGWSLYKEWSSQINKIFKMNENKSEEIMIFFNDF